MASQLAPETTRQKMIGVLYLVLLAMLALNVDKGVLDAFTTVEASLNQSIESNRDANDSMYKRFAFAAQDNPQKAGKYIEIVEEMRRLATDVQDEILDCKTTLVKRVDGPDGDISDIKKKDDLYASSEVMIRLKRGEKLRETIEVYKNYLISLAGEDTVMVSRINRTLNLSPPPPKDGVKLSWESHLFEGYPLAASVTILSKLGGDINNSEKDMLNYLYQQIDAGSFSFNTLIPQVVPKSSYLLEGDTYEARIFLAAVDTTELPAITVSGKTLESNSLGQAIYRAPANRQGSYKYKGTIRYKMPSGVFKDLPFEHEYEVAKSSVSISPTKMNLFYIGVPNPVTIVAAGVKREDMKVTVSNGDIKIINGEYVVYPKVAGKKSIVNITAVVGGKLQNIGNMEFRVKRVPDPVATVGGSNSGVISKAVLSAQKGISAELKDFEFDMKFKISSFNISSIKGSFIVEESSNSTYFTAKQKQLIKSLSSGSKVYIDKIIAKGEDGTVRKLPAISLTLK